jgi:hypothetical protein
MAIVATGLAVAVDADDLPEPGPKCGTPVAASPPSGQGSVMASPFGPEAGRRNGAVVPVSMPFGPIVETPKGTSAQTFPPSGGAPPPSVPGLGGSSTAKEEKDAKKDRVEAIQAKGEVAEERLLDLGIEIFNPGAEEDDREKLRRRGLSPELRRSEARFMSYHLKKTLEGTGNWGAVRVVPGAGEGLDVVVTGRLVESNGKRLTLEVDASDATGRLWVRKRYRGEADTSAYRKDNALPHEAFQEVYNRIANDLLEARDELEAPELVELRRVAVLRFASQLAPQAFASYLKASKGGDFQLVRFPAQGDPMLGRVSSIRERDQMFVDTLNEHYLTFYDQMSGPYLEWRKNSYDEQDALDKIARESLAKKILGGAAILVGSMMNPRSQGAAIAQDALIIGGGLAISKGFQQGGEKSMHQAALRELATSFDADIAPVLVEVEGQQLRLNGSAETQFVAWREMLRQMFALETGLPSDPNAVVVTATPPTL